MKHTNGYCRSEGISSRHAEGSCYSWLESSNWVFVIWAAAVRYIWQQLKPLHSLHLLVGVNTLTWFTRLMWFPILHVVNLLKAKNHSHSWKYYTTHSPWNHYMWVPARYISPHIVCTRSISTIYWPSCTDTVVITTVGSSAAWKQAIGSPFIWMDNCPWCYMALNSGQQCGWISLSNHFHIAKSWHVGGVHESKHPYGGWPWWYYKIIIRLNNITKRYLDFVTKQRFIYLHNHTGATKNNWWLEQLGATYLPQPPVNVTSTVLSILVCILNRKLPCPVEQEDEPLLQRQPRLCEETALSDALGGLTLRGIATPTHQSHLFVDVASWQYCRKSNPESWQAISST